MSTEPVEANDTTGVEVARRIHQEQVQVMPMPADHEMRSLWRLAAGYAQSGIYKDITEAQQAYAKLLVGRDLGLSPARAMSAVQFVEGNVQIHYRTLLSWVRERGLQYKFPQATDKESPFPDEPIVGENPNNDRAIIDFYGPKDPETGEREFLGRSRFSQEDAELAGLRADRGRAKSNFIKYPRNMLVARATSNGIGWFCPEVLNGIPVYVEGEIPAPERVTLTTLSEAPGEMPAAAPALPERIAKAIARTKAIDSTAWHANEVAARIPSEADEAYSETVDRIAAEIEQWIAEREPVDAEVVEPDGMLDHDALMQKWNGDERWRANVNDLLNRRVELEDALATGEAPEALNEELEKVNEALAAYGVPDEWLPVEAA